MYYDDDDDPYAPHTGPAAMPSPCSKYAPYYSGSIDSLEDFLEEFEGQVYDCALTDLQRVDVVIRYVDPSMRDFWRSLNGFRSRDWPLFRQSLVNVFSSTTPRPQDMRQKLCSYVQDSSKTRMDCVDDVLQYYRQFVCYSVPLVHAGHLSEEERDSAFWYGFYPEDREVLWPRLLGKNPFQPCEVPFHFEDVFGCARAGAFAYGDSFSSWSPEYQFKPPSARCEQLVAEHISRDTYGLREVTRAVASNAEITPCELPSPSESTSDTQLPSSLSLLALELLHTVHPMIGDQCEPTSMSSTSPTLSSTPPLAHLPTDDNPEITPAPLSSLPVPSDPECLPSPAYSAMDDQPKSVPEPTVSISSTLLPSASHTPSHTPSLAHSAAEDISEIAPTPPSLSLITSAPPPSMHSISSECLLSATEDQPEPEPESASMSLKPSKHDLSPRALSLSPDHLPAPLVSLSTLEISTPDSPPVALLPDQSLLLSGALSQSSKPCDFESTHASIADIVPLSPLEPPLSLIGESVLLLPTPLEVSVIAPIPSHSPPLQRSLGVTSNGSVSSPLEVTPFPASTMIPSTPQQVPTLAPQWLLYLVPHWQLLRSQEPSSSSDVSSMRVPPFSHLSIPTPQWLLYLVPQLFGLQELLTAHEVSSMPFAPRLPHASPPLLPSSSCSAHFTFAFTLVTTTSLFSILLNVSKTIFTHARKFQSKKEDLGGSSLSGTPKTSKTCNTSAQWLGQYMPKASRFVFDPGGLVFVGSAHEDAYRHEQGREPKTRCLLITTSDVTFPSLVLADNLVVFDTETPIFFLEVA